MKINACGLVLLAFAMLSLLSPLCYAQKYGDKVYNRFNIHYYIGATRGDRTECKASYANTVKPGKPEEHGFIPPNTEMTISRWRGGFLLTVAEGRKRIYFTYSSRNMGNMGLADYFKLMFSAEKVTHEGLTDLDKQGIKEGKAQVGMTKAGIKVALGYPAIHKTPSLDLDKWVYWKNSLRTMVVVFEKGKVKKVVE